MWQQKHLKVISYFDGKGAAMKKSRESGSGKNIRKYGFAFCGKKILIGAKRQNKICSKSIDRKKDVVIIIVN